MSKLTIRPEVLHRIGSLVVAAAIVFGAACSGGSSSRGPLVDADAAPTADAASDSPVVVEGGSDDCNGVKCRADQVCLKACTATGDTSCFLSGPQARVCVDLPSSCSRANACNCVPYDKLCPTSGRGVVDCYSEGNDDAIACECACRF